MSEREREIKDPRSILLAGIRNMLLSFPSSSHSRATRLLTAIRDARVLLSLLLRRLTLPRYSANKKKKIQDLDRNIGVTCARFCGPVSRTTRNERRKSRKIFLQPIINNLINKLINNLINYLIKLTLSRR